ncbi:SLC13 family permease [Pyramidobacter sp. CG50-2]|uniref:SLC13 family permease n=1 Tax=Pyramidobacter sp. CG50-2 TaxID=2382160 RepID=UPI0018F4C978|nr:SLC13 family permease [Pyramidobacter sp. CG50-2]
MCVAAGIGPSKSLLALLFGAQLGGFCTLVGVPTNVFGNELLVKAGYESFGLFDITPFGLALSVVGIVYFAFIGIRLIPDTGFIPEFAQTERHPLDKRKAAISCGTLFGVLLIIAIGPKMVPRHVAAVLGALIVVATGCMSGKEAIRAIDWNCALMMGALTVVSTGLNNSGVGKAMADLLMRALGSNPSPYLVASVLFCGTVILTQFISNTASILLFMPVAISMAKTIGINVHAVGMVIILAGAACYATPFAAPQNLMTTGWTKYRFMDFVKAGIPMVLLTYAVVMLLVPVCLKF